MKELKAYMKKHNLKNYHLAAKLGIEPNTIYTWLRGLRSPSLKSALIIEKVTRGEVPASCWHK